MTLVFELGRQALRGLRRHPLYCAFAICSLAATLGAGTLVFSIYDAIAYRSLPVERPAELVSVRQLSIDAAGHTPSFSTVTLEEFDELREAAAPTAALAAYSSGDSVIRVDGRTEYAETQWVDPAYFDTLGVRALRGRSFVASDDPRYGGSGGVVLRESTWRRLFGAGGDLAVATVQVDGTTLPVLGIVPDAFRGFEIGLDPALFGLASQAPDSLAFFHMLGRLAPGTTVVELESRLRAAHEAMRARQPERQSFMIVDGKSSVATERIQVVDGRRGESPLRGETLLPIALVGGLLGLVLAVLTANLASLLAVRALSERGAAAVRMALGASRAHIAGAWFAESLFLTLTGAVLGLGSVAAWGEDLLIWAPLPGWAQGLSPSVDLRSATVAVAVAVFVALLVAGLAAWEQMRVSPQLHLREEAATLTKSRGRMRWRNLLIASQVALSVVLLVAMGLFVRSAAALFDIDTGFPLERVLTFRTEIPEALASDVGGRINALREAVAATPGVAGAGFASGPVLGGVRGYVMAAVEGYEPEPGEIMMLNTVSVSPGFFRSLDFPLASGRFFDDGDLQRSTRSVVVNRAFASRYLGNDPLGRRLSFNFQRSDWNRPEPDDLTVVGIVDDRMISDVREQPTPRIYPLSDGNAASLSFYVRTPGDPTQLAPAIERLVRQRIPEAAVVAPHTLAEQRDRSLRRELLIRDLTTAFGGLAATLAAFGLFAAVSYHVRERRREFALRQALGSEPGALLVHVFVRGLRPVAWGLVAGVAAAVGLTRLAASQLYGIAPRDPAAFAAAVVLMLLVAGLACLPPALRAARTHPARALREQ